MATKDLVKKKTIALTPEVHADLMRVVAAIQAKSGVNTTANDAVRVLLEGWNIKSNDGWIESKTSFPNIGDKLLVEFPNGATHRAIYFEYDGFNVYLETGLGVVKNGFYPFSSATCKRWKLNDFEEPLNEA